MFLDLDTDRKCANGVELSVGEHSNDCMLNARIEFFSPEKDLQRQDIDTGSIASFRVLYLEPLVHIVRLFRASYHELCSQSTNSQLSCACSIFRREMPKVCPNPYVLLLIWQRWSAYTVASTEHVHTT